MIRATICLSLSLLFLCVSGTAQYAGAKAVKGPARKGFDSITAKDCRTWLGTLASDAFEGRETGYPGYQKAADFVAGKFKEFGLEPIGENGSYFQMVPFIRSGTSPESSLVAPNLTLKCHEDFTCRAGKDTTISGDVIFIAAQNRDARIPDAEVTQGKIVVLAMAAGGSTFRMRVHGQIRRHAAAILRVQEFKAAKPSISPAWRQSRRRGRNQVSGSITPAAAKRLAKSLGVDARFVDSAAAGNDDILIKIAEDKPVELKLKTVRDEISVPNVVGLIRGSDKKLRDEVVICGSHLDHIGVSSNGDINNGADDDGSGSTALLCVAKAMATSPKKPRRSVMCIAVCGEEKGLLGSKWYVDHPIFPIEKTVCELQMDMVGRNEEKTNEKPEDNVRVTHLVGSKRLSMQLHNRILELNSHIGFEFEYDEESVYTRSDHYNFAVKGIPIAFFFSGFHPDYHRHTDTVEKINYEKIANTAKLVFLTAFDAADAKKRLRVDKGPLKTEDKK